MNIGYARVSSLGQSLDTQIEKLQAFGCEKIFREKKSAASTGKREAVKEADLIVLDQKIDTTTPTGRLTFHLLGAVAEFERDLINERRNEGMERTKENGVQFGRKPKLTDSEIEELRAAHKGRGGAQGSYGAF